MTAVRRVVEGSRVTVAVVKVGVSEEVPTPSSDARRLPLDSASKYAARTRVPSDSRHSNFQRRNPLHFAQRREDCRVDTYPYPTPTVRT